VPEKFTFKIPDGIPDDVVGPLLCAGITTYAPLARNVKKGDRVGVVGIGGLGHMALQVPEPMVSCPACCHVMSWRPFAVRCRHGC
jgi:uncharacterized zinc-type alcohol dehydrogenase-like protein